MFHRYFEKRHPAIELLLDVMLVVTLTIAVVNQFQLRDEINARRNAAYENCVGSNDSRHVLANVLVAAEALVRASPATTPDQKKTAITFYEGQIKRITYADCSIYKK